MGMEHFCGGNWQGKPKCADEFVPVQPISKKFPSGLSWDWRRESLRKFRRPNIPRLRRGRTISSYLEIYDLRFSVLYLTTSHDFPFLRNQWKLHQQFHTSYRGHWLARVSLRLYNNVTVFLDILRSFLRAVQIIFHRNLSRDIVFYCPNFLHPWHHFKSITFYVGACLFVGTKSTFSSGCRVFFCRMLLSLLCQRTRIHLTVFGFPLFKT